MKRFAQLFVFSVFVLGIVSGVSSGDASAAFNQNRLISDFVFNKKSSMNSAQIDAFLNSFPSSCISTNRGFSSPNVTGYNPSQGFLYGSNVSAGTVIYNASQAYDLNPQVILATLQKEQSLVSGNAGCYYGTPPTLNPCPNPPYGTSATCVTACQYAGGCVYIALGYDCPYYCKTDSTGFSKQIIKAAWKLKFVQQRSLGNYNWNIQKPGWDNSDDPLTSYDGYMTQGVFKRNASSPAISYDGYRPVNNNSLSVHLDTGGTAALYSYTPFTNGNQSFVNLFEGWFGSTQLVDNTCQNGSNLTGVSNGAVVLANQFFESGYQNLSLSLTNNTGSKCIETHVWGAGEKSWLTNIPTNHVTIDPTNSDIISGDTVGNNKDNLMLVKYQGAGSGKVEVHTWDDTYQSWYTNIATNHPAINPANARVITGDVNGDGKDELILVKYQGTGSGKVEVHVWNPGLQSWYTNIATNHQVIDPANARVISGDYNGDGKDELILVKYQGTGSGKVEVHVWNPGLQSWYTNIATNHGSIIPANANVIAYNRYGDGKNEFTLVKYRGTGSGKVEVHVWNPGLQSWYTNIATNHGAL